VKLTALERARLLSIAVLTSSKRRSAIDSDTIQEDCGSTTGSYPAPYLMSF